MQIFYYFLNWIFFFFLIKTSQERASEAQVKIICLLLPKHGFLLRAGEDRKKTRIHETGGEVLYYV